MNVAKTTHAPLNMAGVHRRIAPCGDILDQLRHVVRNAPRLLIMQDSDPYSPTYGCFHYPYWRDKTSEFPDARFQEAGAALGLLSLPAFDDLRASEALPAQGSLYTAFQAGLLNLSYQQYPEGCYDEWYKGERGFAATAFTTAAYGLAALVLGDRVACADRAVLASVLTRASGWLSQHDDVVKTNHEIVATLALAVVWRVTGDERLLLAAKRKFEGCLAHGNEEGWFSELSGADLGYSFLVLDYMMMYFWLSADNRVLPAAEKLLRFLIPHLHPDLTVSPEAGTCRNPYVGQIGFLLFREHNDVANAIAGEMAAPQTNPRRTLSYLGDDLRLVRWAILPVLAALFETSAPARAEPAPLETVYPQGWTIHSKACLAAYHNKHLHVFGSLAGGPVTRVYHRDKLVIEDLGLIVRENGVISSARVYDASRPITSSNQGIVVSMTMTRMRFFFPSLLQRLVLRIGSTTSWSSRMIRAMIDKYRIRNRTAINQSATSAGKGSVRFTLDRQIEVRPGAIRITDLLRDKSGRLSSAVVQAEQGAGSVVPYSWSKPFRNAKQVRLSKTIRVGGKHSSIKTEAEFA